MLNIAICDDDSGQLALIAAYTSEFFQLNQYEATISRFLHPDDLLNTCEKQRYLLYILDIVMPMVNGIDVGKAIRKLDQEAQIIYATYEPGFALQSFDTNPINYLLKPIDKQKLFKTLTLAVSKLDVSMENTFPVNTHEGMRILRLSEIICCEYSRHTAIYTLVGNKTITTKIIKGNFTQYTERLLQDRRFIRPHVSYVVNMDYIETFNKNRFTLLYGYSVPIVAKQYSVVRDIYMNYLISKESTR
jgi:DNA-binding LytR/AlgR family response regulator